MMVATISLALISILIYIIINHVNTVDMKILVVGSGGGGGSGSLSILPSSSSWGSPRPSSHPPQHLLLLLVS